MLISDVARFCVTEAAINEMMTLQAPIGEECRDDGIADNIYNHQVCFCNTSFCNAGNKIRSYVNVWFPALLILILKKEFL